MPAVKKVSKDDIIDAAIDVLRDDGFSAINARSVAKKLGCSTQPIYFSFKSMEELRQYRTTATIRITGRPFCKNQLGRPCFCSQERTDSSCQAGSVSQNQIR